MYIKPTPGRQVPDPERGGFVPEKGRYVEQTQFWLRRVTDGDVVEADPPQDDAPAKSKGAN